jgi:hypothetical protein
MAEIKLTTRDSFADFAAVMKARKPFRTSGALFGGPCSPNYRPGVGILPEEWQERLRATSVDYVVYSYATPIAWHDAYTGEWIVPDVKYSTTTSKHQGKIRSAVNSMRNSFDEEDGLHRDGSHRTRAAWTEPIDETEALIAETRALMRKPGDWVPLGEYGAAHP